MTVLRRFDSVLETTKNEVLQMKKTMDENGISDQDLALRTASGQSFYSTSEFTLVDLKSKTTQQQLHADFESYLDGFSLNVQDILENFEFRKQIDRPSRTDVLGQQCDTNKRSY